MLDPEATQSDAERAGAYVHAAGVRTYYEVEGTGDPVILLHGGFATIETWSAQRAALAHQYRVYLPERRGHGRTPDVPGPYGRDVTTRDTVAFMEALDLPSAHLVGWSDGGMAALDVALTRPDLVRKLVLIGTVAHIDGLTAETRQENERFTAESLPQTMRDAYAALSPDGPAHFPIVLEKTVAVWRTEPRHELSELEHVTSATLILVGDNDVVTIEHAAAMKRAIPEAQLAVVPGADHFLLFEKPDLVNRLILDFLAEESSIA
jgi:pimeloyl-ACP methyl ester carboxylesterase